MGLTRIRSSYIEKEGKVTVELVSQGPVDPDKRFRIEYKADEGATLEEL